MLYFTPFPIIQYQIPNTKKSIPVTDITRRFSVANFLKNSNASFDEYFVQDGERPETVAYDYYGDVSMDWLILLCNEIVDPYFQWVLSYEELNEYVKSKYGSVEWAMTHTHHYEQIIQKGYILSDAGIQRIIKEKTLVIDRTTYLTLSDFERKIKTVFDYESDLNEERRKIFLLDTNYYLMVKEQHRYIFEDMENIVR
jgi:hypothetical protein